MSRHLLLWLVAVAVTIARIPTAEAQTVDTTRVLAELRSLANELAAGTASSGGSALVKASVVETALLLPDLPLLHSTLDLRDSVRHAIGVYDSLRVQHVVTSADGLFGCAVGVSRFRRAESEADRPKLGRFATCWHRRSLSSRWILRVFVRTNAGSASTSLDSALVGAPHSSTVRASARAHSGALEADRRFARLATDSGPALAFARFAADDGMLLGARPTPRRGPTEIKSAFSARAPGDVFTWTPLPTELAGSGGLAMTIGEATIREGGSETRTKYLSIWRLEPTGQWKFIFDIGNSRP